MEIAGEKTTNVEGKEYWFVDQFSKLTQRKEGSIRVLVSRGNRVRRLHTIKFGGKPLILASELFNFPFVITGRPSDKGDFIERFYMEKGELFKAEEILKNGDQSTSDSGV